MISDWDSFLIYLNLFEIKDFVVIAASVAAFVGAIHS
jgi:hypothetical protein